MTKRLRKFNSTSEYKDYLDGETPVIPNVSYCSDISDINYVNYFEYYKTKYLTFITLENGTFTLTIGSNVNTSLLSSISYSTDNGLTWTTTNNQDNTTVTITTPTVLAGDKILWKGEGIAMSTAIFSTEAANRAINSSIFSSTGEFNIEGNIMSLLYGDDFQNKDSFENNSSSNFALLFYSYNTADTAKISSIEKLVFPANTLADQCYVRMFQGAPLVKPPIVLPARELATYCYASMFLGCTNLTTPPKLPAINLESYCYYAMFSKCTNLTVTPKLIARKLAPYCYQSMFQACASLTEVPKLPAIKLAPYCYYSMFYECTSIKVVPKLPATTLASHCYHFMFGYCSNLTTVTELPAIDLIGGDHCYDRMFRSCSKLNYVKAMFITDPMPDRTTKLYTDNWLYGVSSTGTFVKNINATWTERSEFGIPVNWTVETASI